MLTNALLLRLDSRQVSPVGSITWSNGSSLAVRVAVGQPENSQRWTLGATIKDASAVVCVGLREVPAIGVGDRMLLQVDGQAEATYEVIVVRKQIFSDLSHSECFVKQL